jgi:transcriptional regulator with XRE-family HTH domain
LQQVDPDFVAAKRELEPGYQVSRLRIQRGLTYTCPGRRCRGAQLAELVGTRQPSIARLENGKSVPSLSFLDRIVKALDTRIELHIVPEGYFVPRVETNPEKEHCQGLRRISSSPVLFQERG